jgi:hypothetical protein
MQAFPVFVLGAVLLVPSVPLAAATVYYSSVCGEFFASSTFNNTGSGLFVCPSAAALGITSPLTGEFLVYDSDYSSGLAAAVSMETDWSFSGANFAFASDTTTVTGASSSDLVVSSDGLTLNAFTDLPPDVLAGFYDNVDGTTGFGTPTVSYSSKPDAGSALDSTGYVEVVYVTGTDTVTATPEPKAEVLIGFALIAMCFVRRFRAHRSGPGAKLLT